MDWWKEKFPLPKGYFIKERYVEEGKTKFIIANSPSDNKWVGFKVVEGNKLEKYKTGKSPLDVRNYK